MISIYFLFQNKIKIARSTQVSEILPSNNAAAKRIFMSTNYVELFL